MKNLKRTSLTFAAVVVGLMTVVGLAWAYFSVAGSGGGEASTATLNAPAAVVASSNSGTVTVEWTEVTAPDGDPVDGYYVQRYNGSTPSAACATTTSSLVTSAPCSDTGVANGTYTYRVTAVFHGWTATSAPSDALAVVNDVDAPTTDIAFPVDSDGYRASDYSAGCAPAGVCGTASDTSGVQTVRVSVRQQSTGKYLSAGTFTASNEVFNSASLSDAGSPSTDWSLGMALPADGVYVVHVQAVDVRGNAHASGTYSSTVSFRIDATPPFTTDNSASIGNAWKNTDQTVTLTPSDGGVGVAGTYYTTDGSTPTTGSSEGTSVELTTDGIHTVKYFSVDAIGNAESVRTAGTAIRVDETAPDSATLADLPSSIHNGQVLTGSGTDATSGVASITYLYCAGLSCTPSTTIGSSSTAPNYPFTWNSVPASGTYLVQAKVFDAAGNSTLSAPQLVNVDGTPPQTSSINRVSVTPTNASSVSWTVTFNESVTGVASGSFSLVSSGVSGTPAIMNVSGTGTTWTVTASTGTGTPSATNGTLRLDLTSAGTIVDGAGNALAGTIPFTGQAYTLDRPSVNSINLLDASPNNGNSVRWTVTFSESMTNVATGNFSLTPSGLGGTPAITGISGSGATRTVTASTGSGSGTLRLNLASAGTIVDGQGNPLATPLPFAGATYTIDRTAPTVTINQAAGQADPTKDLPVNFTVTFSEAVAGFVSSDVTTNAPGSENVTITGTGPTYNVAVGNVSGAGTVTATIAANRVTDLAGNNNTASTSTDNTVTFDNAAPTVSLTAPTDNGFVQGSSVSVTATASDTGSGVASVQFQTSPANANTWTNLGAADTTSSYGVTWNTTSGYSDGFYDLRAVVVDNIGNTSTAVVVTVEVQNSAPQPTSLQLVNKAGGVAGRLEQGDKVVVTYSQTLRSSSLCSAWSSNNTTDRTINGNNDVTVNVDNNSSSNDVLTVSVASQECSTFRFGSIDLGNANYVTGWFIVDLNIAFEDSALTWDWDSHTLTITLGSKTGSGTASTVSSSTATYSPQSGIVNTFGTAITGTKSTGNVTNF